MDREKYMSISEIYDTVGITRRALQGYDEMGLIHPTIKGAGGMWLYDEAAVEKLVVIQVLAAAGYTRKKIKELFEAPQLNLYREYARAIEKLEGKKERIDGMIIRLRAIMDAGHMSDAVRRAYDRIDARQLLKMPDQKKFIEEALRSDDVKEVLADGKAANLITLNMTLHAIGSYKDVPEDAPEVRVVVEELHQCVLKVMEDEELQDVTEATETSEATEVAEATETAEATEAGLTWVDTVQEFLQVPVLHDQLETQCGKGAVEYIKRAVDSYDKMLSDAESKGTQNTLTVRLTVAMPGEVRRS